MAEELTRQVQLDGLRDALALTRAHLDHDRDAMSAITKNTNLAALVVGLLTLYEGTLVASAAMTGISPHVLLAISQAGVNAFGANS